MMPLDNVTPYAGVWIEISNLEIPADSKSVTPYAGVWIEIIVTRSYLVKCLYVTPYAGVWIEIFLFKRYVSIFQSLPMRECGLKLIKKKEERAEKTSLPMRECGLKYVVHHAFSLINCHSLCGSVD